MLPSQTTRGSQRRSYRYRRHRSRWIKAALVLAVVGGVAFIGWKLLEPVRTGDDEVTVAKVDPPVLPAAVSPVTSDRLKPKTPAKRRFVPPARAQQKKDQPGRVQITDPTPVVEVETKPVEDTASPNPAPAGTTAADTTEITIPDEAPTSVQREPIRVPVAERVAPTPRSEPAAAVPGPASGESLPDERAMLTALLERPGLDPTDAEAVRERLTILNQRLVFSPEVVPGDPFAMSYVIQSGDTLAKITKRLSLQVDWRFIQRINRILEPHRIRAGQKIKLITGPFHAVIDKSAYRMDLYMGDGLDRVFVRSFIVGLGEYDSTPIGLFRVAPQSKLIDPEWINPRTRERFTPGDPANPIGERWLGLEGLDDHTRDLRGYGIHGTIEPQTIGTNASMGCVRMLHDDVVVVYEMLVEGVSEVAIQ